MRVSFIDVENNVLSTHYRDADTGYPPYSSISMFDGLSTRLFQVWLDAELVSWRYEEGDFGFARALLQDCGFYPNSTVRVESD